MKKIGRRVGQHYETQGLIATGRGSVTIEDRERLFPSAKQLGKG
jgi:hypothetical protein